jgi:hypothetical protein
MESDKWKKPPIYIKPERAMLGHDTLAIGDGENTYIIDLKAFMETVPVITLKERWIELQHAEDPTVKERLRAAGWKG